MGFVSSLRGGISLAAIAFASIFSSGAAAMPLAALPDLDPEMFMPGMSRPRYHIDTRGMRAHRQWKTARRSGRHDWRSSFAAKRHG